MDSLDLNLHELILTDLGRCYALHPAVFDDGEVEAPSSTPEILDTFGLAKLDFSAFRADSSRDGAGGPVLSQSEASSIIAFANYVSAKAQTIKHEKETQNKEEPDSHAARFVKKALGALQGLKTERCLGAQGPSSEWLLPDKMAFALAQAAIAADSQNGFKSVFEAYSAVKEEIENAKGSAVIEHLTPALHGLQRAILSTSTSWTSVSSILKSHVLPAVQPLSEETLAALPDYYSGSFAHSSHEGKYLSTILSRYENAGAALSVGALAHYDITILSAVLSGIATAGHSEKSGETKHRTTAAEASKALVKGTAVSREGLIDRETAQKILTYSQEAIENSLSMLSRAEEQDDVLEEEYQLSTVAEAVRVGTAACIASGQLDSPHNHVAVVQNLLSDSATIYDERIQRAALDSLSALVHRFPEALADGSIGLLRKLVITPLPILQSGEGVDDSPSATLIHAADTLASLIKLNGQHDITLSTVYSLLNYLPSARENGTLHGMAGSLRHSVLSNGHGANGHVPNGDHEVPHDSLRSNVTSRTPDERAAVSANTLLVVTALARRVSDKADVTKLCLSMLLQRLKTSTGAGQSLAVELVAMRCIADLAPQASHEDFADVVRVFCDIVRSPVLGHGYNELGEKADKVSAQQEGRAGVFAAQIRLASNLKGHPELAMLQLRELLILFTDASLPARSSGVLDHGKSHLHHAGNRRSAPSGESNILPDLLDILTCIEAVMAIPDFEPHVPVFASPADKKAGKQGKLSEEIVMLFRNLWFVATVLGLSNQSSKETRPHRNLLKSIAVKTPCLLYGTPLNYVDTELEYNPLLRKEHGQSAEHLRTELGALLPSQGGHITARTFSYPQVVFLLTVALLESMRAELGNPSQILHYFHNEGVNNSVLAPALADIADHVTEVFRSTFGQRVRRHAVKRDIASHLKEMIIHCSHPSAKARRAAIRSLDTIFSVFPVLLCDGGLLTGILDGLTMLRNACEGEFDAEYTPKYVYHSDRADVTLVLPDDYSVRNEILSTFYQYSKVWLSAALAASPLEMSGLLQDYLDSESVTELRQDSGMGKSVAMEVARSMPQSAREAGLPNSGGWRADTASIFANAFGTRHTYGSEAKTVIGLAHEDGSVDNHHIKQLKEQLREISEKLRLQQTSIPLEKLRPLLYRAAAVILAKKELDYDILRELVFIPVHAVRPAAVHLGVEVWAWLVDKRADVEAKLMVDLNLAWAWTVRRRRGLFSILLKAEDPILSKTEYAPTDIAAINKSARTVKTILAPHRYLLEFLSSRFQAYRYRDRSLVLGCMRTIVRTCLRYKIWGKHPLCRELRMKILTLGFSILNSTHLETTAERSFRSKLYAAALSWFELRPTWSYGADRLQLQEDLYALQRLAIVIGNDHPHPSGTLSTRGFILPEHNALKDDHLPLRQLLMVHIENEILRVSVWLNPLGDVKRGLDATAATCRALSDTAWAQVVRAAWYHSPRLAVLMVERFKVMAVEQEVRRLVNSDPALASTVPESLEFFLGNKVAEAMRPNLQHLMYWDSVSPVSALKFFLPAFNKEPLVLQYAMRVLEQHPVDLVFFYIPQVVQALRTDPLSYMERFIFETSKISQLFCHQMIWTMKANCYKDDLAEVPDPDKDKFERMVDLIVSSLSGEAQAFYEKEFGFFNEVTSISRKLMPFVKKTKPEKKAKIDEEMAKIEVERGVYLPSHPEGQVIDIDRHSGRPLQSHAKTPFMATFKVSREIKEDYSEEALESTGGEHTQNKGKDGGADEGYPSLQGGEAEEPRTHTIETKLSAIFKVGDDCRQDVLALQVIAQFKNMFNVLGLDLQVQPYRVLATGPGTGIIDVVPNATSRDEMGRAKINDLTSFFLFQFGPAESVEFQKARNNFIQSMAAYSVLCYILQIKDRHNGNIMIDGEGRITHIDFGFLFDIGPGGIKFEPNSFKLTNEMITLMGGKNSQGYRQFYELTVKAFLSCRGYVDEVVSTCNLMMATDLPSFKGEGTMHRLRERFRPELSEREAAQYMVTVIDDAAENGRSIAYDQFQYFQNKIPYAT